MKTAAAHGLQPEASLLELWNFAEARKATVKEGVLIPFPGFPHRKNLCVRVIYKPSSEAPKVSICLLVVFCVCKYLEKKEGVLTLLDQYKKQHRN